jgi:hypothetical protein
MTAFLTLTLIIATLAYLISNLKVFTEQLSQALSWPAVPLIAANFASNVAQNSSGWIVGPINMALFRRALGIVNCGGVGGAVTGLNTYFIASNASNTSCFGNWAAVSGGPTCTNCAPNTSTWLEMRADQMPAGKQYLCLLINNACLANFSAELFGGEAEYKPASQNDLNASNLSKFVM